MNKMIHLFVLTYSGVTSIMSSCSYSRGSSSMDSSIADDLTCDADNSRLRSTLRLVVFDLDYTVWKPEMYQLDGPPRLVEADRHKYSGVEIHEMRTTKDGMILTDDSETPIRMFSGA
jgi:hypothetical protein